MTTQLKPVRRSQVKHDAILHAAAQSVGRDGYAATTIEKIAAIAGVGKQTIYRWWPSKAALFVEVYANLVSDVAPPRVKAGCCRELQRFLSALFQHYHRTHAGLVLQGLLGDMSRDPIARDAVQRGLLLSREPVLSTPIAHAIASGELSGNRTAEDISTVIIALVWQQLLLDHSALDAQRARSIVRIATAES